MFVWGLSMVCRRTCSGGGCRYLRDENTVCAVCLCYLPNVSVYNDIIARSLLVGLFECSWDRWEVVEDLKYLP